MSHTELTTRLSLPNGLRHNLPRKKKLPGTKPCFRNDPDYPAYEEQEQYDEKVFNVIVANGFGKDHCPKEERWLAVALAGGICFACIDKPIDPTTCLFARSHTLYHGLWQLVVESLEQSNVTVPNPLKESLWRWMAPSDESTSGPYSESYSTCSAAENWQVGRYCPGDRSFGQISLWAHDQKDLINEFSPEEQAFLRLVIAGVQHMRLFLSQEIRPRYQW